MSFLKAFRKLLAVPSAALTAYGLFLLSGCVHPVRQSALPMTPSTTAQFLIKEQVMVAQDGARLGLTVWEADGVAAPKHVIVGVHGMNNYAGEFRLAGPAWAKAGITTYAYDQRGFGRSLGRGIWPEEELMREDLRTAVKLARARHPDATLTLVGISMGAAVAITALASDEPPDVDRFIASGPGLRGWGALNPAYAASLWASARTRPGWIVEPPRFVSITPTDNIAFLREQGGDVNYTFDNRIDQVHGVVSLMEHAHDVADRLPADVPVLISYGARDEVIPENGPRRTAPRLPSHVRTVYYEDGYHILLSDLQRETVFADYVQFMHDPDAPLPSGAPEWPFR